MTAVPQRAAKIRLSRCCAEGFVLDLVDKEGACFAEAPLTFGQVAVLIRACADMTDPAKGPHYLQRECGGHD